MNIDQRNKKQLPWTEDDWNRIDKAVHDECKRIIISEKFLPLYPTPSPNQTTIPSDTIITSTIA